MFENSTTEIFLLLQMLSFTDIYLATNNVGASVNIKKLPINPIPKNSY